MVSEAVVAELCAISSWRVMVYLSSIAQRSIVLSGVVPWNITLKYRLNCFCFFSTAAFLLHCRHKYSTNT